ncbi:MAG: hypothetical protein WBF87_00040, partial [Mesorhizobium sp.]
MRRFIEFPPGGSLRGKQVQRRKHQREISRVKTRIGDLSEAQGWLPVLTNSNFAPGPVAKKTILT